MFDGLDGLGRDKGHDAQQKAVQAVVNALYDLLPPEGDHIEHRGFYLARLYGSDTVATTVNGGKVSVVVSREVDKAFVELRRVMYMPGFGSWFSVWMTVWADGHAKTEFNYDHEPDGGATPPGGIAYISDLQMYPIDEANRPEWLKQRVAEGIADLRKYGKKSYPPWLLAMVKAGNKPSWL